MDIEAQARDMDAEDGARFRRVARAAQAVYGPQLQDLTCPGGSYRTSYRVHLGDRTVIATCREVDSRTLLEAYVLHRLQDRCDDLPRCLGVQDGVLFQSDVGGQRLTLAMVAADASRRQDLAAAAVAALFRIHAAGRAAALAPELPHLGATPRWVQHAVNMVRRLEKLGATIPRNFDRHAAYAALTVPPLQMVKWDCRGGNAALDPAGKVRWFDLEYVGARHGAEDFAWLIADETWPMGPAAMLDIVRDAFDPTIAQSRDAWLEYLSVYTVFHAMERLRLVQYEVKERGWKTREKVLGRDDVGMHPDFAAQLCDVAAYFADRSPLTAPLVRAFETVGQHYRATAETI